MIKLYILFFLLFAADGRQVAYVDLSRPQPFSLSTATGAWRGGGLLSRPGGWIPPHIPLPLSVKLIQFTQSSNPAPWSVALEVAVTNIGTTPVSVPVGVDTTRLLDPSAKGRRSLGFGVWTMGDKGKVRAIVGARSDTNADEAKSSIALAPGDYVVYKIGIDRRAQGIDQCVQSPDGCRITVNIGLRQKTLDGGVDYFEAISDDIDAVNWLKWNPPPE